MQFWIHLAKRIQLLVDKDPGRDFGKSQIVTRYWKWMIYQHLHIQLDIYHLKRTKKIIDSY